uniref:Uncharacterized protein n=1 Tax=Ananas comosus var. bracteatus TaxID=296719 RepID=A0A6V7NXU0_ANACO|nr:unnamed protein product [Ananas comosus var. bracteatus]
MFSLLLKTAAAAVLLLLQARAAAAAAALAAAVSRNSSSSSSSQQQHQDAPIPDPPAIVPPPLVIIPPVVSGPSDSDSAATRAEHKQSLVGLTAFMRFNPPIFDGKEADLWILETWLTSMEALFEDICTLEKDKIHLAAHCFEKDAQIWWIESMDSRRL